MPPRPVQHGSGGETASGCASLASCVTCPYAAGSRAVSCNSLCGKAVMRQEGPDEDKVSNSAIFRSELIGNFSPASSRAAAAAAAAAAQPNPAQPCFSSDSIENLRVRRRSSRRVQQVSEPRATSSWPGASCKTETVTGRRTILATSSRADRGAETVSDGRDRMDFHGLRARGRGAKEAGSEELDDLRIRPVDGVSQVEARTPPAMERNLFLSALANGKLEHHRNDVMITLKRVVAGGLAGMLAKSVVAPVDRIKILFQVTNEKFSFKKAEKLFQDILALEGPAGLWKGNSATMIRVFPYAGTQFMMFDSLKRWALLRKTRRDPNAEQRLSNMESLMSGSFAGATSALVTYPLDLARARLAVGHARKLGGRRRTMGVPELLKMVVRQDGFLALYRGVTPSLLGIIPYAGIAFSINEQAKHEVVVLTGKEPGTFHKLGIGALAGLIAQSCTYPLEVFEVPKAGVVKERTLMHRLNIFQTFMGVLKEQGVGGLFKGLSMNWVKGPVGISISFTTFDFLKRQFGIS